MMVQRKPQHRGRNWAEYCQVAGVPLDAWLPAYEESYEWIIIPRVSHNVGWDLLGFSVQADTGFLKTPLEDFL